MTNGVTPAAEAFARVQVARDARRTTQPLGLTFAKFWRHPSPYLLCGPWGVVDRSAHRRRWLKVGTGDPGDLLALLPFIEWTVHVGILHWKPRRVAGLKVDPLLSRRRCLPNTRSSGTAGWLR